VRTWDAAGVASPYSEPARWEVGPLTEDDWRARWIAAPGTGEEQAGDPPDWRHGNWIWHPTITGDNATVYLVKLIDLGEGAIETARIRCTADNRFTLWLNGTEIGSGDDWGAAYDFVVADSLRGGGNTIMVRASNAGGPCGFRFSMHIAQTGADPLWILSDATWRAGNEEAAKEIEGGELSDSWEPAKVLGPYGSEPWGTGGTSGDPLRSMLARKEFALAEPVKSARAYVCGLGAYELRINGQKIGNDALTPGWTDFPTRVQYQTYDVTGALREGPNAVGAILGSGWWHGRIGGGRGQRGRDSLRLILQFEIEYANGRRETIATDPTWRFHEGPITSDSIYDGEVYDARLELPGWDQPNFDDSMWTPAATVPQPIQNLVPQAKETIQVYGTLPARDVIEVQPGVFVFDFGQNMAGWTRLTVQGDAGDTVVLRHAETLKPDGMIYTDNLRSAKATDTYILRGGEPETYEPRFTYHGFRYVEVTGYPGEPTKDALVALAASTATRMTGEFECSSDLINRIQHNIIWGQRSNMYSVPTDCPQRDERLGWTGDAQMFCPTSCFNADMVRYYTKWMRDIRDCRRPDGAVLDVNPANGGGPAAPAWGDACVLVPWYVYRHYGDTRILEENWDCMVRWVQYMTQRAGPDGLYLRNGYGDWIAVVRSPSKPISAAYYCHDLDLMSRMARVLGRDEEAAKYADMATAARAAFSKRFLNEDTNQHEGGTQTANLIPLQFDLVPEDRIQGVLQNVVDDIVARGAHLSTGFLGTGYINPVLTRNGHHDLAWRLAAQSTYPSWGYMAEQDATTIWELWNSDRAGPGMNSRNHFCLGSVGEWFFQSLAGISAVEPGFKVLEVQPRPAGDLAWVKCRVDTPFGPASSNWQLRDGDFHLQSTIPANASASILVPTFGNRDARITEGDRTVHDESGARQLIEDVRFEGFEGDFAQFSVGAGEYSFVAHGVGAPKPGDYDLPTPPTPITELTDDFSGDAIDADKWEQVNLGLESQAPSGIGARLVDGALQFSGTTSVNYWAGRTLLSRGAFSVQDGQRLEVEIDRLSLQPTGTGTRSSLWLWVDAGSYLMFSQDTEKSEWSYNLNGQTGSGTRLLEANDLDSHRMKLVHDGKCVHMFLDDKKLGEVPVGWSNAIRIGITGQARMNGDALTTTFDNLTAKLVTE